MPDVLLILVANTDGEMRFAEAFPPEDETLALMRATELKEDWDRVLILDAQEIVA